MNLPIKPAESCQYDLIALGEVMLRLDPGEGRIRNARHFRVWEGGGEYNVARAMRKCFGLRSSVVTAFADNEVGRLLEDLILQGGVDASNIVWRPYDGIGRISRNGINFTERGFGLRGSTGTPDRGHTAVSQLKPGDVDWQRIFSQEGARWLHLGGIFSGLSETCAELTLEAAKTARKHGTRVSYDMNYRASLWKSRGGVPAAREINRMIAPYVDVMIGNEGHFRSILGSDESDPSDLPQDPRERFEFSTDSVLSDFPNLHALAATVRSERSASRNDWGAIGRSAEGLQTSSFRENLEILDRVGGGDGFASGLIFSLMSGHSLATALEYGVAHGALAMTTPGDSSMAKLSEVEDLVSGSDARANR